MGIQQQSCCRSFLLAEFLVLGCAALLVSCSSAGEGEAPERRDTLPFDRFVIQGVSHTAYEGGHRLFTFEAEEMIHRKRKVGPLTINPIKEIELTGVKLVIYGDSDAKQSGVEAQDRPAIPLHDFIGKVSASRNLGLVSRVIVDDLEIALHRDGVLEYTLAAGRATAGSSGREIDFEDGFSLTSSAGQELTALRARWSNRSGRLRIDGDYRLNDGGDVTEGSAARFALVPAARILILD